MDLLRVADIPELRSMNLHGVGKWNRCIRENSEYFRNFDYDEIYPINAEQSGHFLYRKLSLEFFHRVTGVYFMLFIKSILNRIKIGRSFVLV